MAESNELKTVKDGHVTCREHDDVHTVHVEGGRVTKKGRTRKQNYGGAKHRREYRDSR